MQKAPQNLYWGFAPGPHWSREPPAWSVFILVVWGNPPKFRNPIRWNRRTRGTNSWLDDTDKNVAFTV